MATSTGRKRLLFGASAIAAAAALAPAAKAATLYVGSESAPEIYQIPNAGYTGSVVAVTSGNNYVALSNGPSAIAVDSNGNVVASSYNTPYGAYAFSPSGTTIGTSSGFGNSNFAEQIFNGNVYVTGYTAVTSGEAITELSYTPSGNSSASFGTPTYLNTGSSTNHGYGLAVAPASESLGDGSISTNTASYLFFTYGTGAANATINAINLSNGNSLGIADDFNSSYVSRGLVYDPYNGDLYAGLYNGMGAGSGRIDQIVPQYNAGGTLTGYSTSLVTLTNNTLLSIPDGMAFGPDGNLYVADQSGYVFEVNIDGNGTGIQGQVNEYLSGVGTDFSLAFVAVPEPASLSVLALGAGGILMRRRRSRSA